MTAAELRDPDVGGGQDPRFGQVMAGAVLLVLGSAWLLDVLDVVRLRPALVLPGLLTATGLALMIGSLRGDHPGLVTVGVLLTIATVFSALIPSEALRGGIGDRRFVVTSQADLESRYELAVGDLTLDLADLDLTEPDLMGRRRVTVTIGAGDLTVVVPPELPVTVEASTGAGDISLFGDESGGMSVEHFYRSPGYDDAPAGIELHLQIGAGTIAVTR